MPLLTQLGAGLWRSNDIRRIEKNVERGSGGNGQNKSFQLSLLVSRSHYQREKLRAFWNCR
jgi:hypothetical protein